MTVLKETSDAVSSYYKEHAQAAEVGLTALDTRHTDTYPDQI